MSRTTLYKGIYVGTMGGVLAVLIFFAIWLRFTPGLLLAIPILFIPGRVLAFFWRDLLTGLRLLNAKEFALSKVHSEQFLETVRAKPWIKRLIWLGSSSYSRDPEALALNNLGAAELALGEMEAAQRHLDESLSVDPLNPLPYFNLGALHQSREEGEDAERCFARARELGYTRGWSDKVVNRDG